MSLDEKILWKKFKKGNRKALDTIFETYYEGLYSYGLKLTGNSSLVKDCIQDFFLKLWLKRKNLRDLQFIKPYLFFSFRRNLYYNLTVFNKLKENEEPAEADFITEFSHEDFLIFQQEKTEKSKQLVEAINKLTNRQREIIYLRYFEDFKIDQIAELLEINEQSVRNRLHQAISRLREIL